MKKAILAIAAAATIAAGTLSAPTAANAGCRGCWVGGAFLGGAVLGAAIASQPRYYAPGPGYVVYSGYAEPFPYACPGGYWARRVTAVDPYGQPVRWSRPRPVCP